jgi:hypothetical protein
MTYLDATILDLTEWFCRRFQVLTGRTNVWLAVQLTNLSIVVYFVWAAAVFWNSELWIRVALALFCSGLFYVLTQTIFRMSIEAYETNAYHRVAKGLRNPRRVRDALLRISFLTLSIGLLYPILLVYFNLRLRLALLSYSLIILTTVVLYLLACDPLPPCTGKLREWLRGWAMSRAGAPDAASGRGELSLVKASLRRCVMDGDRLRVCRLAGRYPGVRRSGAAARGARGAADAAEPHYVRRGALERQDAGRRRRPDRFHASVAASRVSESAGS